LRVLARSATGQEMSAYTTYSTGPRREGDPDGPEEFHVVLIDNGRTEMLGSEFKDMLRLRRWCSGTSNRWCEMRVRMDGKRNGGLIESEAFWININQETHGPARIADDFLEGLQRTTEVDRLRWKAYLKAGSRVDAVDIRAYPVRVSDIDIFDHMNNSVYWSVIEDYLAGHPDLLAGPLRVNIEHDLPVALGDNLEIITHVHSAGSTDQFGPELVDRTVTTLTYAVGDEVKAVASLFAL